MNRAIKIFGVVTSVGMLVVLVAGATVTNTGSEHGCGKSWPLCHGQLIPTFAVSTLIEWIHRVDAAVETILILTLSAGALYLYGRRLEMRILVGIMIGFLFLQAGLGAWAVMYPQLSVVLALHFGVSLVAFASVLLTTIFLFEVGGREKVRDIALPRGYRRYVWGLAAFTYLVVYSGAYIRHTNADDACSGWPLCNGSVLPALTGKVTSAFGHRIGAALLTCAVILLVSWSYRLRTTRPDVYLASLAVLALVVLQALVGAVVAWTDVDLFAALAHAAVVGLMFGALAHLCVHSLPLSVAREQRAATLGRVPVSADAAGARR